MKKVIVVGGGLAGLATTMRLSEKGCDVDLICLTKVKRSHSVCAQGGINAALNIKEKEDSALLHAYDTIKGGDFLANQPPILEMCLCAPLIIQMMDRLGCPFNRTANGHLDVRRFGGTLYHRTVFCGASTGQQLLYTLDEQVRRFEAKGRVTKYENYEFMRLIQDDHGQACGIVAMNLFNQKLEIFKADAVVIATGGPGVIFKKSTNSTFCTGAANGRLYRQGMTYANGEFIQIHPTAIPGHDKLRLISESVRAEGARVWVYGDSSKTIKGPSGEPVVCGQTGKPWYFLEELYPAYGNLVARDVGAREILKVCKLGLGIGGHDQVYLDATALPPENWHKLASVLEIYEKFTGEDPKKVPMRIFPAVHYSMGGAWVDWPACDAPDRQMRYRQMTNLKGCFNCGESDYQYHGANRLGANSLLSCIFSGLVTGDEIVRYIDHLPTHYDQMSSEIFNRALKAQEAENRQVLSSDGPENVHRLHDELSDWMIKNVTVERNNPDLEKTLSKLFELKERFKRIRLDDTSCFANQTFAFALQFEPMLELAMAMTAGAYKRDEFRGSHFKEGFPKRDDEHFLKTTLASYTSQGPEISYEPVDTRHLDPVLRDYTKAQTGPVELKNVPSFIPLPL